MSRVRTWNIRLNLDEFNAIAASVYTDSDRALLFQGMALGLNGGKCPDSVPEAFARAHAFGSEARQEAEAFRSQMSQNGARGGRPSHRNDPGECELDNGVEEPAGIPDGNLLVDQSVNQQGYQTCTQSTIHNPLTKEPKAKKQKAMAQAPRFSHDEFDHLLSPSMRSSQPFMEHWHNWLQVRNLKKKRVSEPAAKSQIKALHAAGIPASISAIARSIANDWTGLFPEIPGAHTATPAPQQQEVMTYDEMVASGRIKPLYRGPSGGWIAKTQGAEHGN